MRVACSVRLGNNGRGIGKYSTEVPWHRGALLPSSGSGMLREAVRRSRVVIERRDRDRVDNMPPGGCQHRGRYPELSARIRGGG